MFVIKENTLRSNLQSELDTYKNNSISYEGWDLVEQEECLNATGKCYNTMKCETDSNTVDLMKGIIIDTNSGKVDCNFVNEWECEDKICKPTPKEECLESKEINYGNSFCRLLEIECRLGYKKGCMLWDDNCSGDCTHKRITFEVER